MDGAVIPRLPAPRFLTLVVVLGGLLLPSGRVLSSTRHLPDEVPASPSSYYEPSSALPEPAPEGRERGASMDGRVLSLAQCIGIALERNPEARRSWRRSRSAAAAVGRARSPYLPSAELTAGANRGESVFLGSQSETGPANTFSAAFGVGYLLFDGGARSAGRKGAGSELMEAGFRHDTTLQEVALRVEQAYYELSEAKQLERVAEQTVRQTQYHVDVARARHENGLVARFDVLEAETERADADLLRVRARSRVRIARGRLANAMGLRPSESFEVAELPEGPRQPDSVDIERVMTEASKRRPELRAALARVRSDAARLDGAKAEYWPKLTVNADYGLRDRTFFPDLDEWSVGVAVTFPLFEGFDRKYAVHRAEEDLAETAADYEALSRGVELDVWTAYSQVIEAGEAIDAARALVASAEEGARVAEGEYRNGTASIIQVTDAQTSRTTANVRLVQARVGWYTAIARLAWASGRRLAGGYGEAVSGEQNR